MRGGRIQWEQGEGVACLSGYITAHRGDNHVNCQVKRVLEKSCVMWGVERSEVIRMKSKMSQGGATDSQVNT